MNQNTRTDKRKVCFVHLPKCGGTSLIYGLRNPLWWDAHRFKSHIATKRANKLGRDVDEYREECLVKLLQKKRYHYLMGHFRCTQQTIDRFDSEWDFITLMRNPVDRWFSHYFFNRYKPKKHFKTYLSLEDYLKSESGQAIGSMYVRFLSGIKPDRSEEAVNDAIENLKRFSVVGVIEKRDQFIQDFERTFERPLNIRHKNKNPKSKKNIREAITPEIRAEVEKICQPDMAVYNQVVRALA